MNLSPTTARVETNHEVGNGVPSRAFDFAGASLLVDVHPRGPRCPHAGRANALQALRRPAASNRHGTAVQLRTRVSPSVDPFGVIGALSDAPTRDLGHSKAWSTCTSPMNRHREIAADRAYGRSCVVAIGKDRQAGGRPAIPNSNRALAKRIEGIR